MLPDDVTAELIAIEQMADALRLRILQLRQKIAGTAIPVKTKRMGTIGQYYTLQEVGSLLKVSPSTVKKMILDKKLSALLIGRQFRIKESDLIKTIEVRTLKANRSPFN